MAAALLLVGPLLAAAQPVQYQIDPSHTHVHWEVLHFGTSTTRGRFDSVEGVVTLDRGARSGDVSITVNTASVNSGIAPFDGVLRSASLLSVLANPQAYFVARQLTFDGDKLASVRGEFTLRGVGQPLTLRALNFNCTVQPTLQREVCGGDFEGELQRSSFGITYALPFVADRVRLVIQVEAVRQ
jgi:polyisoprenoid-binding protein YceI